MKAKKVHNALMNLAYNDLIPCYDMGHFNKPLYFYKKNGVVVALVELDGDTYDGMSVYIFHPGATQKRIILFSIADGETPHEVALRISDVMAIMLGAKK